MCKVPGFGGDSDRIVTSVTAVGNRTFVTCRTPLIKRELHMGKIDSVSPLYFHFWSWLIFRPTSCSRVGSSLGLGFWCCQYCIGFPCILSFMPGNKPSCQVALKTILEVLYSMSLITILHFINIPSGPNKKFQINKIKRHSFLFNSKFT